jgi:hypothetical protein
LEVFRGTLLAMMGSSDGPTFFRSTPQDRGEGVATRGNVDDGFSEMDRVIAEALAKASPEMRAEVPRAFPQLRRLLPDAPQPESQVGPPPASPAPPPPRRAQRVEGGWLLPTTRYDQGSSRWGSATRPMVKPVKPSFASKPLTERLVMRALGESLPALPAAPVLPPTKGDRPLLLVLDLMAWVELSRAHYRKNPRAGAVEALRAIRTAQAAGALIVPATAMNLGEVVSRQEPESKRRLASFIVELSGNISLMREIDLAAAEFELGVRRVFLRQNVVATFRERLVKAGLDSAFLGEGVAMPLPSRSELEQLPGISPDRAAAILERVIRYPEMSIEFLVGMKSRDHRVSEAETAERLREIRQRHHGQPERAIVRHEVEGLIQDELYRPVLERMGVDVDALLSWLTEETAAELITACPSLDVMMTLLLAVNRDLSFPIKPNDYRDFMLLRAGIAYADIVVTEKGWAALANREGLSSRYGTTVLSLKDLPSVPPLIERTA